MNGKRARHPNGTIRAEPIPEKRCKVCGHEAIVRAVSGREYCLSCHRRYNRKCHQKNKAKWREWRLSGRKSANVGRKRRRKQCSGCGRSRNSKAFGYRSDRPNLLRAMCRSCTNRHNRDWRMANVERMRLHWRKGNIRRKGIREAKVAELIANPKYVCDICGDREPSRRRLAVDHCHKTGILRGQLCRRCNIGLGYFLDNPSRLRSAADYLELYSSERSA